MTKEKYKDIWVFAEQQNGKLCATVFELIAKANEFKQTTGEKVTAVLLGHDVDCLADELAAYGADEVIVCSSSNLADYSARPYQKILTALAQKYCPSIILYSATPIGCDLAPRMMVSLQTGLTADAIDLGYDEDGEFFQTTPGYGGKILARIVIPKKRPQMVTVRSGVFNPKEPDYSAKCSVIHESVEVEPDLCYEVISRETVKSAEKSIEEASLVVSGGRGIRTNDDLNMLRELADLLGGQVAASRPLVDSQLLPHSVQIGQSGKTIKPEMIINVAISGSVQYRVGMQQSDCIVSVNKSAAAPIFELSNYGVVDDYRTFIPAVIAEIKKRKGLV